MLLSMAVPAVTAASTDRADTSVVVTLDLSQFTKLSECVEKLKTMTEFDIDDDTIRKLFDEGIETGATLLSVIKSLKEALEDKNLSEIADKILSEDIPDLLLHGALTIDGMIFDGVDIASLIPAEISCEFTDNVAAFLEVIAALGIQYNQLPEESQGYMRENLKELLKAYFEILLDELKEKLGDADGDGEVTIIDATAIQRWLADMPVSECILSYADFDGDGEVTILDATAIQRYLAGLFCPWDDDAVADEA